MSIPWPLLLLHISGAFIGVLSGAMAVVFRKGSGLHAVAGTAFFISMLGMTSSGAYIAVFLRPNRVNFMMAVLTAYLVLTAWMASKRRDGKPGLFDWIALLVVFMDGAAGWVWGFRARLA